MIAEQQGIRPEQFKWTDEWESLLEDLLVKHLFDFRSAAKELKRLVWASNKTKNYDINVKTL